MRPHLVTCSRKYNTQLHVTRCGRMYKNLSVLEMYAIVQIALAKIPEREGLFIIILLLLLLLLLILLSLPIIIIIIIITHFAVISQRKDVFSVAPAFIISFIKSNRQLRDFLLL